ncbi:hypothetical protein G3I60_43295 [Streptomyces sp. SID13666]|uniref:hypothetical protein n=1 Tax=unclassified Streptomyces TaxID=2593676 RepID=UPI0013C28DFF|nr:MULTISPECIES: hypothetical protein [unclassified Streptomyces]NEA60809.1 hypothetical protein [Streptomyces sp. SID13666]NEA73776.1 hypothetical protein [Streptomyces sp. SID13588]
MPDHLPEITSVEEFMRLRLSEDPAEYGRSAWAAMALPLWGELVREHPDMRVWAAHNRSCPPQILAELIKDDDWRVRSRVASRRNCPAELLAALVDDPDDAVRNKVATHRHTPRWAVLRLTDDPWTEIAEAARIRIANWPQEKA